MKLWKTVLAVGTGAAIVALGAYYAGVFNQPGGIQEKVAAVPGQAGNSGTINEPAAKAPATDSIPAVPGDAGKSDIIAPAFDVVRVEPGGGVVIAGTAAPDAQVEIVAGSTVIATTKADAGGRFVAVLDDPLKPGDYQIVLRATAPDGLAATSPETAVVSVPETKSGQVLALVEQPGEPSRLITKPEPEKAVPQAASEEPKPETTASPREEKPAQDGAGAEEAGAVKSGKEPAGQDEPGRVVAAQEDPGRQQPAAAPADPAAPATEENQRVAMTEPAAGIEKPSDQPSVAPAAEKSGASVSVEAVEIDGNAVFVAGNGRAGSVVRIYANDILLGQTTVSPIGRFLLETVRELPVGDYIIRADMLDARGVEVVSRAAVPFEREAGEKVSAVAAPASGDKAADAGKAAEKQDSGAAPQNPLSDLEKSGLPELNTTIASTPPEIVGTKLTGVDSSVIIRRGDNLWRISRRVYGRGIRYTTIYLANQDQIRDPDRIWPGQVFSVPEKTAEGEVADRAVIEERMADDKMSGAKKSN